MYEGSKFIFVDVAATLRQVVERIALLGGGRRHALQNGSETRCARIFLSIFLWRLRTRANLWQMIWWKAMHANFRQILFDKWKCGQSAFVRANFLWQMSHLSKKICSYTTGFKNFITKFRLLWLTTNDMFVSVTCALSIDIIHIFLNDCGHFVNKYRSQWEFAKMWSSFIGPGIAYYQRSKIS